MGTWLSAFFDNEFEFARDVYNEYVDYLSAGVSGRSATKQLVDDFAEEFAEAEGNERLFWMSLAVTQWQYGRLEPRVKAKAVKIIKNGGDVDAYPAAQQARRKRVLEKVRLRLESPQPPEKPVRIIEPPKPLKKIERLWKRGQVVAFRRASGRFVLLLTEFVYQHKYLGQSPHFVLLNWEAAKLPSPERIRKLRATSYVVEVFANKKGEPVPWDRVQRLDVVRDVIGIVVGDRTGVFTPTGADGCYWKELDAHLDDKFKKLPVRSRMVCTDGFITAHGIWTDLSDLWPQWG